MPLEPDGAQRSPDGHYWWDEHAQQWELVDHGDGQAQGQAGSSEHAAAAGLPSELIDEIVNFAERYPQLTALAQAGDSDTYLRHVVGIEDLADEHNEHQA
jgi:hypothetical protein